MAFLKKKKTFRNYLTTFLFTFIIIQLIHIKNYDSPKCNMAMIFYVKFLNIMKNKER